MRILGEDALNPFGRVLTGYALLDRAEELASALKFDIIQEVPTHNSSQFIVFMNLRYRLCWRWNICNPSAKPGVRDLAENILHENCQQTLVFLQKTSSICAPAWPVDLLGFIQLKYTKKVVGQTEK